MELGNLPSPFNDHLAVYVIGPGFGESQVVAFPDGRWAVIDCCTYEGECAPLALLEHFDVDQVDLLLVTHPDRDHIGGLPALLKSNVSIEHVWRYPQLNLLKSFLAQVLRRLAGPGHRRLRDVADAADALDEFVEQNRGADVAYGHRSWPPGGGEYQIHILAPTQHDRLSANRAFMKLIESREGEPELASRVVDFLTGEKRRWSGNSNGVSMAVTLQWGENKILLSGDVEKGTGNPHSGWEGVLQSLDRDGLSDRIENLRMVKVAHHGSDSAFWYSAWRRHARDQKVEHAVVTPFSAGVNNPPHVQTLTRIQEFVKNLIVTSSNGGAQETAEQADWVPEVRNLGDCRLPLTAVMFSRDGSQTVYLSDDARLYSLTP